MLFTGAILVQVVSSRELGIYNGLILSTDFSSWTGSNDSIEGWELKNVEHEPWVYVERVLCVRQPLRTIASLIVTCSSCGI